MCHLLLVRHLFLSLQFNSFCYICIHLPNKSGDTIIINKKIYNSTELQECILHLLAETFFFAYNVAYISSYGKVTFMSVQCCLKLATKRKQYYFLATWVTFTFRDWLVKKSYDNIIDPFSLNNHIYLKPLIIPLFNDLLFGLHRI